MMQQCRWCGQLVEVPARSGRPAPFIINRVAHMEPKRRKRSTRIKASARDIEQRPILTWSDVESRARQFWEQKRAERTTDITNEPAEVAA